MYLLQRGSLLVCSIILLLSIDFSVGLLPNARNEIEKTFLSVPNPQSIYNTQEFLTSAPRLAGTPDGYDLAVWVRDQWIQWGLNATIEVEEVLLTYPISHNLSVVSPSEFVFTASLVEPYVPLDPTSNISANAITFNGYAPSGDVTAELVYVNYGTIQDFQHLQQLNVSVAGKIVIVRYGRIFRGTKVMLAQQAGAVGVIIYSDPIDDGYWRGEVYPNGPYRPEFGVQRGSVQYMSICPGDPRRTAECISPSAPSDSYVGTLIPNIPVLPISWGDALPILRNLTGATVKEWVGGLPIPYHIGPGPITVHLQTEVSTVVTPIWNVVARIDGERDDDEGVVVVGAHRDAWVFGSEDNMSGTSVLHEVAKGLSVLLNGNGTHPWKPQRSIYLCSWDGEEYGLLGSTGFGERHASFLQNYTIAYINVDGAVGGTRFDVEATPSLSDVFSETLADLPSPGNSSKSIYDQWDKYIGVLGGGSDYTVFIDGLTIPSINFGYSGISGGIYHSIYDSFYWMKTFGDPQFLYHTAMSQLTGLFTLRISESKLLPLNFATYATQLQQYYNTVSNANKIGVDLSSIKTSIANLQEVAEWMESLREHLSDTESDLIGPFNKVLLLAERSFYNEEGLPQRLFFKHVVQAPGIYKGYGADVFPGLLQALEEGNSTLAQAQAKIIATRIESVRDTLYPVAVKRPLSVHKGLTPAAIAGIVIASIIAVIIIAAVVLYYKAHRRVDYKPV
eukprot:TRINITY_DN868_c0_g2_i1.p1 TRINITY_DN868_c0_g2~~TRINITY_DN868_c0_g2_i1.p1  ORF type:complete len:732 (-),score=140.96 TRINITY_DN868_c0_g2_i1:57-2252(-)